MRLLNLPILLFLMNKRETNTAEVSRRIESLEGSVPALYNLGASFFFLLSRGFARDIHYRMKQPLETNAVLAELAHICDDDHVLDAGCGQGSSTIFLAQHYGVQIDAVTISKKECRLVTRAIEKMGYAPRVAVSEENMLAMPFPHATFSVVWAVESMCHVDDKLAFLKEAHRTMREGGRLVLADFFLTDAYDAKHDKGMYQRFCEGFLIPSLTTKDEFLALLSSAGFTRVRYHDYTEAISHTAREREKSGWLSAVIFSPLLLLKLMPRMLVSNIHATIAQGKLFRHNKLSYGVIYAEK